MLLPVLQDRTQKPPFGTPLRSDGHWSVQGLVGAWAFNEGAGLNAVNSALNAASAVITATWSPLGLHTGTTAEEKYLNVTTPAIINLPLGPFTAFSVCKPNFTRAGGNNAVMAWGGTDDLLFMPNDGTALGTRIFWRDCGGNISATHTESNGLIISTSFTATPGVQQIYHNGLPIGTPGANNLSGTGPFSTFRIGSWSDGTGAFGGEIVCVLLYSAALSPSEIAALSSNPWQIYEPEIVWLYASTGGPLLQSILASFPAPSGALSIAVSFHNNLEGSFPTPSGSIVKNIGKGLSGGLLAASGSLTKHTSVTRQGSMPAPSATLVEAVSFHQAVVGAMGSITAMLTTVLNPLPRLRRAFGIIGARIRRIIGG